MGKNIAKSINKNLGGIYSQKHLNSAKPSPTDVLKTASKRVIPKTAEAIGLLIGNKIASKIIESLTNNNNNKFKIKIIDLSDKKIADGITKFERNVPQNDSKTVTNLNEKNT